MPLFLIELSDTIRVTRKTTLIVKGYDLEEAESAAREIADGDNFNGDTAITFEEEQVDASEWDTADADTTDLWKSRFLELLPLYLNGTISTEQGSTMRDLMRELGIHQNELRRFKASSDPDDDVLDDDNFGDSDDGDEAQKIALKERVKELRAVLIANGIEAS